MGMMFSKAAPLTVTHVHNNDHAHDLGIQVGWVLKFVNDTDLSGKSGDEARAVLFLEASQLPTA